MPKIIISRTLIFLISIGLSYLLPVIYQDIVGFLLILSIGVIHGANDLLIIKKYTRKDSLKSQINLLFVLFRYSFSWFLVFLCISINCLAIICFSIDLSFWRATLGV